MGLMGKCGSRMLGRSSLIFAGAPTPTFPADENPAAADDHQLCCPAALQVDDVAARRLKHNFVAAVAD
eukprot:15234498-Heterocapsa_arctica.AAC.1